MIFGVAPGKGQQEFLETVGDSPQVVGVFAGHTHRNFVGYAPESGRRTAFVENGPSKEYPGGFGVVSVYDGGWMRTFQRLRDCAFCRDWIETTRGQFNGLYPLYTLGPLSARAFTHLYDCDAFTPPPSLPGNESLLSAPLATTPACARATQAPGPTNADPPGDAPAPASPAPQVVAAQGDDGADEDEGENRGGGEEGAPPTASVSEDEPARGDSGGDEDDGALPFTGGTLAGTAALGAVAVAGGLALRRRSRAR